MFRTFGLVLLIFAVIGSILWGANRHEKVLEIQSELASTKQDLSLTQADLRSVEEELNSTQQELTDVEWHFTQAEDTISSLESELELYQDTWGSVFSDLDRPSSDVELVNSETASNPTWAELLEFLREDKTDENRYVPDVYVCRHFARDVHNNAERAGMRAAYVSISYSGGETSHAVNAFKTTDRGLVFIDCTGARKPQCCHSYDAHVIVGLGAPYIEMRLFPEEDETVMHCWSASSKTIRSLRIYW
jgi:hypothetical protein